jgi:hypothetical protein
VVPPASETATVSFELPDERDLEEIAGCVRDVGDRPESALLLWSKGGGETGDEVFPSKTEFPKEELLLNSTAVTLSGNAVWGRDGGGSNVTCICVGGHDPKSNTSMLGSAVD